MTVASDALGAGRLAPATTRVGGGTDHLELTLTELASGIFLVSLGVLLIEIAFTRVFSYVISYHFAYLTIATALLGFGSAGSVLASYPHFLGQPRDRLASSTAIAGAAATIALLFSSVVRFDPAKISSDPATMALWAAERRLAAP